MRNLDSCRCWRCTFCPCKLRNKFLVDFWNRTILLCIPCVCVCVFVCVCVCIYIYRFQNVFLRCPTPRLHCFLSPHWPFFRFLSFMASLIPSIQFFFGLRRAHFFFSASTSMLFWVIFLGINMSPNILIIRVYIYFILCIESTVHLVITENVYRKFTWIIVAVMLCQWNERNTV